MYYTIPLNAHAAIFLLAIAEFLVTFCWVQSFVWNVSIVTLWTIKTWQ